ncbi:MAG: nitroreductase family protein [Leptospirillum sp.]
MERIRRILDLARWAPSGDNTQPWRFEIVSDTHIVVHGSDTRLTVVYDLQGHASQLAIGVLLEYLAIAASGWNLRCDIVYREPCGNGDDPHPTFDVRFEDDPSLPTDPLFPFLKTRSVNRKPLGTLPLTPVEKDNLSGLLGPRFSGYRVRWIEGWSRKAELARILQRCGKLRLTIPEAYRVHRQVIAWRSRFSEDRIPDRALGLSPVILPLMEWIMGSWERVRFFNRFLGGTLIPRLQLDIFPALFCSAHFVLLAPLPPRSPDAFVEAGRVLARFWLGVTKLGLQFQPEMTPLIFRAYHKEGIPFSGNPEAPATARKIAGSLELLLPEGEMDRAVFLGRVGRGEPPSARSLRLPLDRLRVDG